MKKIFMFLAVIGVMAFTAQYAAATAAEDTTAAEAAAPAEAGSLADLVAATSQDVPLHQQLKTQFIDGGPGFMSLIVLCLILGLAVCIERIIYLSLSKTNTPTPRNSLQRLRKPSRTAALKQQRKFVAIPAALSQAFSIRVFSALTRASRLLKRPSYHTVQFR